MEATTISGLGPRGYSPSQVDRIWLWVYKKIRIYPIFDLLKGDYNAAVRKTKILCNDLLKPYLPRASGSSLKQGGRKIGLTILFRNKTPK